MGEAVYEELKNITTDSFSARFRVFGYWTRVYVLKLVFVHSYTRRSEFWADSAVCEISVVKSRK